MGSQLRGQVSLQVCGVVSQDIVGAYLIQVNLLGLEPKGPRSFQLRPVGTDVRQRRLPIPAGWLATSEYGWGNDEG